MEMEKELTPCELYSIIDVFQEPSCDGKDEPTSRLTASTSDDFSDTMMSKYLSKKTLDKADSMQF